VGVLDKLEAKGRVVRYRSTRDRRVVHDRTTEAGQAALADLPDFLSDSFIAAFGQLPVERREELAEALDVLAGFMVGTAPQG
jgi:DNA-binding MarR family transcriptional regulator